MPASSSLPLPAEAAPDFPALLRQVMAGRDLARAQARAAWRAMLAGEASETEIAALLVALAMKGETVEEITGFAEAMRAAVHPGSAPAAAGTLDVSGTGRAALEAAPELVDTCGTGGDASGTFNISTAAALIAAGAGLRVAKHGNRSLSSRCGSADVLEALGVVVDLAPAATTACLRAAGIGFFFAPTWHPAMRHVQPVRRALRVRTVFNLLGPLTNPAGAASQVVGVYAPQWTEKLASALLALGTRRAMVVHGEDGLDEFSTTAPTRVAEVRDGAVHTYRFDARDYGLPRATLAQLAGGDAAENAAIIRTILKGAPGPCRDIALLNAAAALVAASPSGATEDPWPAALGRAQQSLDSGAAQQRLDALVTFTRGATPGA
ncbi:MAG: anthranilate phosphoribosyltransferase [Terriglobales bacterium]